MKLASAYLCLSMTLPAAEQTVRHEFPARNGDLLQIQNDKGRIHVRGTDSSTVRVQIRHSPPADASQADLLIAAGKVDNSIRIRTIFAGNKVWPVDIDVEAPRRLDVTIWGGNAEVLLNGLQGRVGVEAVAGAIDYSSGGQPAEDIRLSSATGEIRCRFPSPVNLRAMLNSGKHLSWGTEVDTTQRQLERESGGGGPLLYAASAAGSVSVAFDAPPSQDSAASPVVALADTIRVDVNLVELNISVKDPVSGNSLPGLRKEDFLVYDKGSLRSIEHFESTEAPFHLLLLVDTSESTRPKLGLIKSAAVEFARRARPGDHLAVATFHAATRIEQPFTRSQEAVVSAIGRIVPGGGTAMYDAVMTGITEFLAGVKGRKAIVLFSDGVDNRMLSGGAHGSRHSYEELLDRARACECLLYPVFLAPDLPRVTGIMQGGRADPFSLSGRVGQIGNSAASPELRRAQEIVVQAENQLRTLAETTGGRFYSPRRAEDLSGAYAQVMAEIRVQYTVGFRPPPGGSPGEWRPLKVRVREQPLTVVRTRSGYFAAGAR